MRGKGQLHLEAMLCFAIFLAMVAVFLNSLATAGSAAQEAMLSLQAKSNAELCCVAVDSVYANGSEVRLQNYICTADGKEVESKAGGREKQSQCIASGAKIVQAVDHSFLEVGGDAHYR